MRSSVVLLLLAVIGIIGTPAALAQVDGFDLWQEISDAQAAGRLPAALKSTAKREIVPQAYRTLTLNKTSMAQLLASAPAESPDRSPDDGVDVILPLPQGGYGRFSVLESSIMEPALAAQFPEIKTYLVQGLDDPTATGRIDTSPRGFRAMVIGAEGTFYIDPYWSNIDDVSICYAKKDFSNEDKLKEWSCGVVGSGATTAKAARSEKNAARPTGATLRIYRAAIAATGEYTAFHDGTVPLAMAAITTTLNRVNTVYERDFCLRMVLVGNNDLIVYTNAGTDPYTNGNTGAMITQNQTNLDSVIGNANYDIGHVFGTDSGGLAGLGVVCVTGQKARGVTGSSAPVGDPFDIDYVAHEMGHQFNAEHTFNASGNGNINPSTAFEPGSGSTIMSYAGIIAGQNLQALANDYFHTGSYTEIDTFITTGSGRFAFQTNATGNSPPVIGALSNYTIPARTPFALTASATDASADTLTYCWEEYDLGAAQNPVTANPRDNGASPIFRSYTGTTNPTRLFPSLTYILNNTNVPPTTYTSNGVSTWATGEAIPTTSRTMTYRVSVRDNRSGGGGQNWASTQVTTVSNAGPFRLSSQNTATTLTPGTPFNVTWDVAGTTNAPISAANVKISLSTNGGTNFPVVLAESVPNNGSASVTVPAGTAATAARLKVEAVGNIFFDINDANLTVQNADAPIGIPLAPGQNYTQNFDISSSATASLPAPWRVDKSTTVRLVGDYGLALTATERAGGANLSTTAGNGIYNFGTEETGRAIGGLSSSSASKSVNVYTAISNTGSEAISSFNISYDVQRFRNGANANGFRVELFYSPDGVNWTSAGNAFLASFAPNADNNGAAVVPMETISISNQALTVPLAAGQTLYLAWNYSVTATTTTSNAQALGVANVSITAGGAASSGPLITSFSPEIGPVGTSVTINGLNFGAGPTVRFNGVEATSFSVNASGTVITATVPAGATTGPITVEVAGQPAATSSGSFTVGLLPPSITVNPTTITGLNGSEGVASTSRFYTLDASNLTGDLVVAPSVAAFEVSTDDVTFGPSVTLTPTEGAINATVYVRLAASAPVGVSTGTMNNSIAGESTPFATTPTLTGSVAAAGVGELIAGWDFQTTTTGGTAVAAQDAEQPKLFNANVGTGTMYLDGSNGSSDWISAITTSRELNAFAGTAINATDGLSTTTTTPAALALVNTSANGKSVVFRFSMAGYQGLAISLAAQRTATGFAEQVWEYSTDGTVWSSIGALVSGTTVGTITSSFANSGVLSLPTVTALDNASNAYVRVTFNGASAATGNNRIDNIQFRATPASGPRITVSPSSISSLAAISGAAGTPQQITVTGAELTAGINVAVASANYQIAVGGSGDFGSTAALPAAGGTIDVRIAPGVAVGPVPAGTVTFNSTGASEKTLSVSGTVTDPNAPFLLPANNTTLTGFTTVIGTNSTNQTFTLSGSNLAAPVTITPPAGWQISATNTNNWTAGAVTIATNPAGVVSNTPIHVRLAGTNTAATNYNGSILPLAVAGSLTNNVLLSGSVTTNTGASLTLTGTLTNFATTQGAASPAQSFVVQGSGLTNNVTVSAPANLEFATNTNAAFNPSLVLPATGGALSNTVFARIPANAAVGGPVTNTITATSGSTTTNRTAVTTVAANTNPVIAINPTNLSGFLTPQGTASTNQTVTVSGTNLQSSITVTAAANYEVSRDGTNFSDSLQLTPVAPAGTPVVLAGSASINDATNDIATGISTGAGTLDIVKMEVSDTATDLVFSLTVNGNISTNAGGVDWGNFMIGIANGKSAGATNALGNAWNRPINMITATNGGMTHWIGSWVNNGGGAQLWAFTNSAWSGPTSFGAANYLLTPGAQSVIQYTVAQSALGVSAGDTIFFDAYSSGGGATDSAVDALSNTNISIAEWAVPYTSGTNTGISSYTIGGGGGGGGDVPNTAVYVRLKADATAADAVGGTLTATSQNADTRNVTLSGRVAQVVVNINSLAPFTSLNGAASDAQSFTVSGAGLSTTPITVNAPTGFVVSTNGGTTYTNSITLTPVNGAVASTTVTVRMPAGQSVGATPAGNIALTSAPASQSVAVSGTVVPPGPLIQPPASAVTNLFAVVGNASVGVPYVYRALSLSNAPITNTATPGYEISTNNVSFAAAVTNTPTSTDATFTNYVRIAATAPVTNTLTGSVSLGAAGADSKTFNLQGTVAPVPAASALPASLTNLWTVAGFASSQQAFNLSVSNLVATNRTVGVSVAGGAFQVSTNSTSGFASSLVITGATASLTNLPIFVRLESATPGNFATNVTVAVPATGPFTNLAVPAAGTVLPRPVITATPGALSNLDTVLSQASPVTNFAISGTNLLQGVTVALADNSLFEISTNSATGFTNVVVLQPLLVAADRAANYTNGWTNGANAGTGFGPWVISVPAGATASLTNPAASGIAGMTAPAFALSGTNSAYADAIRPFAQPLAVGQRISVNWGNNFDAGGGGNKGVNILAGGTNQTELININMGGDAAITINGQPMFTNYGTTAITLNFQYVATNTLLVSATGRDGVETYRNTFTVAGAPDAVKFYAGDLSTTDLTNRLAFFDNLVIAAAATNGGGTITNLPVYARLKADAPLGPANASVQVTSGPFASPLQTNVTLSGEVFPVPQLTVSPATLSGFEAPRGQVSAVQSFNLTGQNLRQPVELLAPRGYEMAEGSTGPFTASLTIAPTSPGGGVATTIYVRLAADASVGVLTGDIALSTGLGAVTVTQASVALSGLVFIPSGEPIDFEVFGPPRPEFFDPADAEADPQPGSVQALAADASDRIYIGGSFNRLQPLTLDKDGTLVPEGEPIAANRLARLLPDGEVDTTFNVGDGPNGSVRAMRHTSAGLLVAGDFTRLGTTDRIALARLTENGSVDPAFNANIAASASANPAVVLALLVQPDGKILVGGVFDTVGGEPRSNLARLHADGRLDESFNVPVDGVINTIALQADGKILIGGSFSAVHGVTSRRIARLEADGRRDASFDTGTGISGGFNATVRSITVTDNGGIYRIYVAGDFTGYRGNLWWRYLAQLRPDGSIEPTFNYLGGLDLPASRVLPVPGPDAVLVAGEFTSAANDEFWAGARPVGRIAQFQGSGHLSPEFNPGGAGANGPVNDALQLPDGNWLLAGNFTRFNREERPGLVALTGQAQADPYLSWANAWGLSGADADPSAVLNAAGIPNLLVYALGMGNPRTATAEGMPQPEWTSESGANYLSLRVPALPEALEYLGEYSEDLLSWSAEGVTVEPVPPDNELLILAPKSASQASRQFLRLKVILP